MSGTFGFVRLPALFEDNRPQGLLFVFGQNRAGAVLVVPAVHFAHVESASRTSVTIGADASVVLFGVFQ